MKKKSSSDKTDIYLDLLKDLKSSNDNLDTKMDHLHECFHRLDKKVELYSQETKHELSNIKELDQTQNKILEEHHQRSNELKKDNELREASVRKDLETVSKRVEHLEAPIKWWSTTKKKILGFCAIIASIGGAIYAVMSLFK